LGSKIQEFPRKSHRSIFNFKEGANKKENIDDIPTISSSINSNYNESIRMKIIEQDMRSVIDDSSLSKSSSETPMVKLIETYPNVLISQKNFDYIQGICAETNDDVAKKRKKIFNELLKILIPKNDWSKIVSKPNFEDTILACYGEYNNILELVRLSAKVDIS
jgi:hypothetical protein